MKLSLLRRHKLFVSAGAATFLMSAMFGGSGVRHKLFVSAGAATGPWIITPLRVVFRHKLFVSAGAATSGARSMP